MEELLKCVRKGFINIIINILKSKRSISPSFGNLVQMLSARQSNFKLLFKLKMKLRPNVMGEQNKSELKISATPALQTSKAPDSCTVVRLTVLAPASCVPANSTISSASWGPRSKWSPSLQTKGVTVILVILQNRYTAIVKMMVSLLLAQDLKDLSSKYPLSCKQRGQRFAVNSLPGRKTFSSKETIYLE